VNDAMLHGVAGGDDQCLIGRLRAAKLRPQRALELELVRWPEVLEEGPILAAGDEAIGIARVDYSVTFRARQRRTMHLDARPGECVSRHCAEALVDVKDVQRDAAGLRSASATDDSSL